MSKHDLKGIDTKKVGNNKYVNYLFSDYLEDQDLSRKGGIRSLKQAGVNLSDLQPVAPTLEQPTTIGGKVAQFLGAGPVGSETEIVGGKVVGKYRPKGPLNINRISAGLADFTTFGLTDYDQRGGLLGGKHSGSGYGGQQLDYKLPKGIKEQLELADKESKPEEGSKDPVDTIKAAYEAQMDYEKKMDPFNRKGRVLDNALEFASLRAQMPFITQQMKDLSTFKQQQLLEAEAIKQSLPNAVQSRLLAADTGFATQAGAIAGQQDAATRFAGLGMQRRFG